MIADDEFEMTNCPHPQAGPGSPAASSRRSQIRSRHRGAARCGKIARLPAAIRDELNQRLLDGQPARRILPWLNSLPETQTVLQWHFGGHPITEQNLSAWRHGGFVEAQRRMERLDSVKQNAEWAAKYLAAAGQNFTQGVLALAIARVMEFLTQGDKLTAKDLELITRCLAKLSMADAAQQRVDCARLQVEISRNSLELKRHRPGQKALDREDLKEWATRGETPDPAPMQPAQTQRS